MTQVPLHRTLVRSPVAGIDPVPGNGDPLLGEWMETGTAAAERWVLTAEGEGVRFQQFASASAEAPTVECYTTWDGRPWADPAGPAVIGQLVQTWRIAPGVVVRLILDNVAPPERLRWETFVTSADGASLAAATWPVDDPTERNVRQFGRAGEAARGPVPSAQPAIPQAATPVAEPLIGTWLATGNAQGGEFRGGETGLERHFQAAADGLSHGDSDTAGTTFWRIDPLLYLQQAKRAGGSDRWAVHALSDEGARLTTISWDHDQPARAAVSSFTKSALSPGA